MASTTTARLVASASSICLPQCLCGLLELRHAIAAERVGVVQQPLHLGVAARGQVAEVVGARREQADRLVVDGSLTAIEERLDRVDHGLLGVEQLVAESELGQVPLIGFTHGLFEQGDGRGQLLHERVLRAGHPRLEFVELAAQLVAAVPGQLQRVLRGGRLVEEFGAELAERRDLALIEDLLRGNHRVRVLLRVAQHGRDLGALEGIAVDGERDLRGADEPGDDDLDRGEIPAIGLGLERVDDRLDGHLLTEPVALQHEREHLVAWDRELRQ